ncbi:pyridoxal phosphate-dependent decarboxylase family protein [Xenorhabdus cabanillasii]|uniref:Pyridoxal-dependent decarboxylase n=1 Tax=Xenorhabdus cabanillasii JM26 TaxID=1427517 RepID=W1JA27_9GAMM|nr:pyridoxal-dependent decarboxylase [Xenorhabdus cabanillasii]PHM79160.1 putative decarboxylase involved in desferrioxamine biosynthesis [Xenorhabdus cabanillasii JM26]CDL87554.1 Pyridoxal-dependent decarboxylase [Xenorhabdus cabanillasii JM26]
MKNYIREASLSAVKVAAEIAYDYVSEIRNQRVFPNVEALLALQNLDGPLPQYSTDSQQVLERLHKYGSPATVASTGGRYFGLVVGGSTPASMGANIVTSAWDQIGITEISSPVTDKLEKVAGRWVLELLKLPPDAFIGFVNGTTISHVSALAAARQHLYQKLGYDIAECGLQNVPKLQIVLSEEIHISVLKALRLLGFGRSQITAVPCDNQGRIIESAVPTFSSKTILVLQAGNINSGNADNFRMLIPQVKQAGGWVHVDGAFGLWAQASREKAALVEGIEEADSWAVDAHKWLNTPYDCGICIVRHKKALRKVMISSSSYLATADVWQTKDMLPEISRRARSVQVWAVISELGAQGIEALVDRCCLYARMFAEGLKSLGFKILNEVVLNQVVACLPDIDLQRAMLQHVQQSGECWFGGTTWQGREAIRISVTSWATTEEDIQRSLKAIATAIDSIQDKENELAL